MTANVQIRPYKVQGFHLHLIDDMILWETMNKHDESTADHLKLQ